MSRPPQKGWYLRFSVFGLLVFVHWSVPALGATFGGMALAASGTLSPSIFLWSSLTTMALVVVHELGHAIAAKAASLQVHGFVFAGAGGWCLVSEPTTIAAGLLLFAGGWIAQALVFVLTSILLWKFGAPSYQPLVCAVVILTGGNLILMLSSMVPGGMNDGALFAKLAREALQKRRSDASQR